MPYSLKILADTVLKQEPIDSSLIEDPRLKYSIKAGIELALHSWKKVGNHLRVAFAETSFKGLNTWYAYEGHVRILRDGQTESPSLPPANRLKFGIDMGHNAPPDTGARGIAIEDNLTKDVGGRVIAKLGSLGHRVVNCTPRRAYSVIDSLRRRVSTANAQKVDYYVSIHFNAFNGRANGTEIYAVSNAGRRIAQPVLNNIVSLGFVNRRVKNGSHLYVVKNTTMPSILIECCFLDSRRDMDIFEPEAMANAIVRGLTGQNPPTTAASRFNVPGEATTLGDIAEGVTLATFGSLPSPDENVLQLQKSLNLLQIGDSEGQALPEDGVLATETEVAISKFNKIMGMGSSEMASLVTWQALQEVKEQPRLRVEHADGSAVRYVQYRLEMEITGVYDEETAQVVSEFQAQNGLTEHGIFDESSWEKLLS